VSFLKKVQKQNTHVLFILPDAKATGLIKSIQNIAGASITHMGSLNAYEIVQAKNIIVVAEAFETMQQMFTK